MGVRKERERERELLVIARLYAPTIRINTHTQKQSIPHYTITHTHNLPRTAPYLSMLVAMS